MERKNIISFAEQYIKKSANNFISEEVAMKPEYVGMQIFDLPVFAFGKADDELYNEFKSSEIIGNDFMPPAEWLTDAKTVTSVFLPYTAKVRASNAENYEWPSNEWLHGRYEGQMFLQSMVSYLAGKIRETGYKVVVPAEDNKYFNKAIESDGVKKFTTSWSERHVAFACGLGTFGLSKGLITEKGMCGRFGSLITDLDLTKDIRKYKDPYEYCIMCGVCVSHCPVNAISLKDGKNSALCSEFLNKVNEKDSPRYGCGKCQVGVPCEHKMP